MASNDSTMDRRFFDFHHRQIPVLIVLSLLPGLGYVFLGWLNGVLVPALVWYLLVIAESLWGFRLYRAYDFPAMSEQRLTHVDESGAARMVDVSGKDVTARTATATGRVLVSPDVVALLRSGSVPKRAARAASAAESVAASAASTAAGTSRTSHQRATPGATPCSGTGPPASGPAR